VQRRQLAVAGTLQRAAEQTVEIDDMLPKLMHLRSGQELRIITVRMKRWKYPGTVAAFWRNISRNWPGSRSARPIARRRNFVPYRNLETEVRRIAQRDNTVAHAAASVNHSLELWPYDRWMGRVANHSRGGWRISDSKKTNAPVASGLARTPPSAVFQIRRRVRRAAHSFTDSRIYWSGVPLLRASPDVAIRQEHRLDWIVKLADVAPRDLVRLAQPRGEDVLSQLAVSSDAWCQ